MVLNKQAKNKPLEYSVAKKADTKKRRYMPAMNAIPIIAEIRFTLFMIESFHKI